MSTQRRILTNRARILQLLAIRRLGMMLVVLMVITM